MPVAGVHSFLTVASRFENIELIQTVIDELLVELRVAEDSRHWIGLAVREAVSNAIRHGNEGDPEKRVGVRVELELDEVVVRVRDQGSGFDLDSVGDPLAPENLLKPSGRGIFYMRNLMDHVHYRFDVQEGTEVTLRKRVILEEAVEA